MSIDYDDAYARARPGAAFSNGTEWECWAGRWCDRCAREAPFRNGLTDGGCPLIVVAMFGDRIPAEWFEQPWQGEHPPLDRYHCLSFKPMGGGGGGGEPRPRPEPPDMDGLFPRPERRTRMFVQQPTQDAARPAETVPALGGAR